MIILNGYNTKLYSLKTTISVKEETNPLFSSGTNLTFNWGGASDIIETVNIILRSRTHNEKVVSKLQFYIDYLKDGKYRFEDVYGETPFKVIVNEKNFQLYNRLLKIETLDNNQFKISTDFKDENSVKLVKYSNNTYFRKELIKDELSNLGLKVHMHEPKTKINQDTDIYLVDSFGQTKSFFKICKTVFLGGSIIKHGGQNPLEAARFGCKILHGPNVWNFDEIYTLLKKYNVSNKILNSNQLALKIDKALNNKKNSQNLALKIKRLGNTILNSTLNEINFYIKKNEIKKT